MAAREELRDVRSPATPMSLADRVDALAQRLPHDDPRRGELRARIAALANDCGCTAGGNFLVEP